MEFKRYIERSIPIIPIDYTSKRPIKELGMAWNERVNPLEIEYLFKNDDFGLLTGKPSGIIVLDLDAEEEYLKERFKEIIKDYPTPIMRWGKKNKLPSMFYSYTNEETKKCQFKTYSHDGKVHPNVAVELLSTGRQCILPPSMHQEGYKYEWSGENLLDFNLDYLPSFNQEMWSRLEQVTKEFQKKIDLKQVQVSIDRSSGRNNKLFEMMSAKVADGVEKNQAVDEIIEYDLENHSEPWTLDKNEPHKGKEDRARKYFADMYERLMVKEVENNGVPVDKNKIALNLITTLNERKDQLERKPLPHLLGIGQELFQIAYDASYVARSHFTFPAVLSIASIIMGNKICFQGVHPNIYCLLAGSSGSGKSSAMDFIKHFLQHFGLAEKLLGDGSPSGDTALIQNLPQQRERIDVIDEGDSLFLTINSINSYGKKLADTYATLFTSPGKVFLGKNSSAYKNKNNEFGNVGGCFSPYVTMILGLTFKAFEQSVNEHTIEKGFGARILYFADNEKKRNKVAKPIKIPQHIADTVKMWMALEKIETTKALDLTKNPNMKEFKTREANINKENQAILDRYLEEIAEMNFKESEDSKVISILSRSGEYLKKMALICAFFTQPHTTHLEITKECLDWAREFILVHLHNARIFIEGHINQGQYNEKVNKIYNYIKSRDGVSRQAVSKNFQKIPKKERKDIVQDLLEMGKIKEVDKLLFNG